MWLLLKPFLIGLAVSIGLAIAAFAGMQMVVEFASPDSFAAVGLEVYFASALVMLFYPALIAGYVAKRSGSIYGIALAPLPIALFSLSNSGLPVLFFISWLAVGAIGGHLGQTIARKRNAF